MKAEDLMIGNWVYHTNKHPIKLDILSFDFSFEWATPIPLTEENIVELLGFKSRNFLIKNIYTDSNVLVDFEDNVVWNKKFRAILPKHVHQFQQLIKSLEE